MPKPPLKNEKEIMAWVMRRLGAPLLKIELTECHLDDAVEDARRWFVAKKGVKRRAVFTITPNKVEYPLLDEMDRIYDVVFPFPPLDLSVLSPLILPQDQGQIPYSVFSVGGETMGLYSSYTQTLQYIDQAKRVLSREPDWRQEGRMLLIFPSPISGGQMIVEYGTSRFAIEQLDERDHQMIMRYALARAKLDLGRVRSKYDSYPSANGTTNLDGANLLQEGQAEVELLTEEIAQSAMPMGFLTG